MFILDSIRSIEDRIQNIESQLGVKKPDVEFSKIMDMEMDDTSKLKTDKSEINNIIKKASIKYGVDENLINLVANAESDKTSNAVSSKGAIGVMQLMPDTAKMLGVKDPFNAEQNIDGGVKFLKDLLNKYDGNTELALAAYNAGEGNIKKYNGVPPFKETQNYVKKIMNEYMLKNNIAGAIGGDNSD